MARLQKNDTVQTLDGKSFKVIDRLGSGGQGTVYKVVNNNKSYALKWYKKPQSDAFYDNLCDNADKGSPTRTFLWPLFVTKKDKDESFGYIMKLCPQSYKPLSDYLLNRVQFKSLNSMINACIEITASFRELHSRGYSYQDLNDGNFFIEPQSGKVLICDNDNIAPNGINLGILGKPRYMAPEVVAGNSKPNTYSDRFSLAVILFLILYRNHPLEGKRDDSDDENNNLNLYCKNPVFIYDETDLSNRPKEDIHKNVINLWPMYPAPFNNFIVKVFNKRLMNYSGVGAEDRIMERDWLKNLQTLKHSIITCPNCKEEVFFLMNREECKCANCGVNVKRPVVLKIGKKIIPIQLHTKIYEYEIYDDVELTVDTMSNKVAEVVESKNNKNVWGLKNLSSITWYRSTPKGKEFPCNPKGVATIIRSNKISFGTKGNGVFC